MKKLAIISKLLRFLQPSIWNISQYQELQQNIARSRFKKQKKSISATSVVTSRFFGTMMTTNVIKRSYLCIIFSHCQKVQKETITIIEI